MAIHKSGGKSFQIFSERERLGFDQPVRVWRGYRLVQNEDTGELEYEYIQGTADYTLKGCKTNIDDLVEEGHF